MNYGTKVQLLTLFNHLLLILGLYFVFSNSEYYYLLIGFIFYLIFGLFGANIGMHRYLSHRSFKTTWLKDKFLKIISIYAGFGSHISWCALHRHHHKHSDQENDIQDPKRIGILRSWLSLYPEVNISPKLVGDLIRDKDIQFIHKNYFKIIFLSYVLLALVDPLLSIFVLAMPMVLCFHGAAAIGVIPHLKGFGYKVIKDDKDDSLNSPLASLLSLGEGWHNYHHYYPTDYRQGHLKWELDPSAWLIERFFINER